MPGRSAGGDAGGRCGFGNRLRRVRYQQSRKTPQTGEQKGNGSGIGAGLKPNEWEVVQMDIEVEFKCEKCGRELTGYFEDEDFVDTVTCRECGSRYKVFRPVLEAKREG